MTKEELSFVAEALLALCAPCPDAPYYADDAFERKLGDLARRRGTAAHLAARDPAHALADGECDAILRLAGLTALQTRVFRLRIAGRTFEEIGRLGRCTKQSAMSVFVLALKKLTRAYHVYPYVGLAEVYREETRRGLKPGRFGTMR